MYYKIFADVIDENSKKQINEFLDTPMAKSSGKIRWMPDVHAGKGCVIGTTMKIGPYIIPDVVGVDISCGVAAVKLPNRVEDFAALDKFLRENIPLGFHVNSEIRPDADKSVLDAIDSLDIEWVKKKSDRIKKALGTLGGGNHFIEIDEDSKGNHWAVIHTGSRNLGKVVAEHFTKVANESLQRAASFARKGIISTLKNKGDEKGIDAALKGLRSDVEVLKDHLINAPDIEEYLKACDVCNMYAKENRRLILSKIMEFFNADLSDVIDCHHNYIDVKNRILRKGAISAQEGEKVIIPLNMRDGVIIGVGKGNPDWNFSAPHGAGRVLGRRQAKREVSLEDFQKSMDGIFSTCIDEDRIDESPFAYKPAESILNLVGETVDVQDVLKPVFNLKG